MGKLIPKKPNTKGCVKNNNGIYVRQNKKTGDMFTVQIKHPITKWTEAQEKSRSVFGLKSAAVCKWIRENKEANTEAYRRIVEKHRRQDKYKTLRLMIVALHTTVDKNGEVVVVI